MPWNEGNMNILHAHNVRRTRTETTQQIAVPHGIPWVAGKRHLLSDMYIYIYLILYYILYVYTYIYIIYKYMCVCVGSVNLTYDIVQTYLWTCYLHIYPTMKTHTHTQICIYMYIYILHKYMNIRIYTRIILHLLCIYACFCRFISR